MDTLALYSKIELLPEHLKKQVLDYIEFLLSREGNGQLLQQQPEVPKAKTKHEAAKKLLKAGFLKGSFVMTPEFDEPLEDFKEYM